MDILFYGFIVFLFAAVILGIEGVYLWWVSTHGASAQRIARRWRQSPPSIAIASAAPPPRA